MEIESIDLGLITFLVETPLASDPRSMRARRVAAAVVREFNKRLFAATAGGQFRYPITAELKQIRAGSWLIDVLLRADLIADVVKAGGAVAVVRRFLIDYPKLRPSVIMIAKDVSSTKDWLLGRFSHRYSVQVQTEDLKTPEQLASEAAKIGSRIEQKAVVKKAKKMAQEEATSRKAEKRKKQEQSVEIELAPQAKPKVQTKKNEAVKVQVKVKV